MELPGSGDVENSPARLAARAEDAVRALSLRTSGPVDGDILASPGELHEVLGSLKLLVDNLARCLPEMATWLEQCLWCGRVGGRDPRAYGEVAESIFEVASALSRAHRMSAALSRDIQAAQAASSDLVVSE
ncbi:hypothetical protein [Saccharomonospora cyanea]|uniref:Uncharacterized protein n=1 Tax=Saccharomonospora cyanea NA-134 TaxID=882082 RepID=H5XDG1_9PSEU|nr:hypothetical protein [Saccharomonospora cyanea]EHR60253.1 hypothetical protein SaccyDRAFT_1344 [Saccharomonospora cyanea NA-134]